MDKPHTLGLQPLYQENVFAVQKEALAKPPELVALLYRRHDRLVSAVLASGGLDVYLYLGAFLRMPDYSVDKRVPLLVLVKVGQYFPDPLGTCVYLYLGGELFQAGYDTIHRSGLVYNYFYTQSLPFTWLDNNSTILGTSQTLPSNPNNN